MATDTEWDDCASEVSIVSSSTTDSNVSFPRTPGWSRIRLLRSRAGSVSGTAEQMEIAPGGVVALGDRAKEPSTGSNSNEMLPSVALDVRAGESVIAEGSMNEESPSTAQDGRANELPAIGVAPTQEELYRNSKYCFNCLRWGHHQSACGEPPRNRRSLARDFGRNEGYHAFLADKESKLVRLNAHRLQEDNRRVEDRGLEDARIANDRRKEDEAKQARRLNEDRVRADQRRRDDQESAASERSSRMMYRREYQDRFYQR